MSSELTIDQAAGVLVRGGVIAYPTEAVWGLGCDPANESAVMRLLSIKGRAVDKGLILVGAAHAQIDGMIDWHALTQAQRDAAQATWPGPRTWIVPASAHAPRWITGKHAGIAVRISAHPVVIALCNAFGMALVSTSANREGQPAPLTRDTFDPAVLSELDGLVAGETSGLDRPTPIRDARSGEILRS